MLKTDNIVIKSSPWIESDLKTIFGDEEIYFAESNEMSLLMKELDVYKSTSQARNAGRIGDIPTGYTELKASKKRHLFIWNPTE